MITSGNIIKLLTMDVGFDGGAMASNSADEGGALALPVSAMDATTLGECGGTGAVRLVGMTIDGNRAAKAGGGLLLEGSICTIIDLKDTILTNNNVSTSLGGGLALRAVKVASAAKAPSVLAAASAHHLARIHLRQRRVAGGGVFVSGVPSVGLRDCGPIGSPNPRLHLLDERHHLLP